MHAVSPAATAGIQPLSTTATKTWLIVSDYEHTLGLKKEAYLVHIAQSTSSSS